MPKEPLQLKLFPDKAQQTKKKKKYGLPFKSLTLSLEHIIVISIFFIITGIIFFVFGVEQGKKVGRHIIANDLKRGKVLDNPRVKLKQGHKTIVLEDKVNKRIADLRTRKKELDSSSFKKPLVAEEKKVEVSNKKVEEKQEKSVLNGFKYTIQVASFKLKKNADKEAKRLKSKGYDILVVPKGSYSIVCVGKFAKKDNAEKWVNKLRKTYKDCLIRSL